MNNKHECDFGEYGKRYNPVTYYDSILNTEELSVQEYDADNMIEFIKNSIDSDKYIVIDIDSSKVYDAISERFIAEFLFYGYDDTEECFYTPSILSGTWKEEKVSFGRFRKAYNKRKALSEDELFDVICCRENKSTLLTLSMRSDYKNSISLNAFYEEIAQLFLNHYQHYKHQVDDKSQPAYIFRKGIWGVYNGFLTMLGEIVKGEYDLNNATHSHGWANSVQRLIEYNRLFRWRVKLYQDSYEIDVCNSVYDKLDKILQNLEISQNMGIKLDIFYDEQLIYRISDRIVECFQLTESIVLHLRDVLEKYFVTS